MPEFMEAWIGAHMVLVAYVFALNVFSKFGVRS